MRRVSFSLLCGISLLLFAVHTARGEEPLPAQASLIPEFQKLSLPPPQPQGDRDVCSLFAVTALAELESNRHATPPKGPLSQEYLIWAACDACRKDHEQAMFYEAVQGLNMLGICSASQMPYIARPDRNRKPPAAALADSQSLRERWQVQWIKRWSVDRRLTEPELIDIKRALAAGHPVACGLRWPKKLNGFKLLDVPPPNQVSDGHSIALVGYADDPAKKGGGVFQFRNSYGPGWGDKGYGEMSYAYVQAYANDAIWLRCGAPNSERPLVRFEAESLPVLAAERCKAHPQAMNDFDAALWSRGKQLFCGAERGGWVEMGFDVPKPDRYRLRVLGTAGPDFGIVRVALDGSAVGHAFDLYSGRVSPAGSLELGTHDLSAGRHRLRFTSANKVAESKGHAFGLDTIDLSRAEMICRVAAGRFLRSRSHKLTSAAAKPRLRGVHFARGRSMSINRWRASAFLIVIALVGFTLAAGPAAADKKAPIPDAAAQEAAAKRIKDTYAGDIDKAESQTDRVLLARRLILEAAKNQGSPAEQYMLLDIAREMAARGGDLGMAFHAIDEASRSFEFDLLQTKADWLEKIANSRDAGEAQRDLVDWAAALGREAVEADRYDVAKQCASVELGVAHHAGDADLLEKAGVRVEEFDELQTAFDKLKDARATLQKNPKDPAANLAVGKFRCFAKGDWGSALPMLALGDEKLKELVEQEMSGPKSAEEQVNLADGWWGVAQVEKPRRHILERAVFWYTKALPQLKDPELTRVGKRLEEIWSLDHVGSPDTAWYRGEGFGSRAQGSRKANLGRFGGTKQTERAVAAALWWFAHHQMKEGNWSFKDYVQMCKDKSCTGPGTEESLAGATALGLLPFLAAGQTHQSNGPFKLNISLGIYWLISHQTANGDLYTGGVAKNDQPQPHVWMYSHAMATMALCECYGMSGDKTVGEHAQSAINFIEKAQNKTTGGWRYSPGDEGDTSVVGWELMALKTGQMAGLQADPQALAGAEKWLQSVAVAGAQGGSGFTYQPGGGPMETMTAVGLLCKQYLHAKRDDPAIAGGIHFLMDHQPDDQNGRNIYYWYYATQCLHNMADKDWDTWNRKMRRVLVITQTREGCASGSWAPEQPTRDAWGAYGGRIMMTSLSALTLEIYYRYLPLYAPREPAPKDGATKDAAPNPAAAPGGK